MVNKRIILYTGKGGTGKTTIAAATALTCARQGYRTIILSTDPAHSLSDSFDTRLRREPVSILKNLWAQEIDVYYSMEKHWQTVRQYLATLFSWQGLDRLSAEEVSILPGMEEIAEFLWIGQHYQGDNYEVVIVDSAPAGETLRLLSLPDILRWWFLKLFPIGRSTVRLFGPIASRLLHNLPLPNSETIDDVERLFHSIDNVHRLLTNPKVSTMRLVLNPERMVIKETQRTFTYLNLFGYYTDAVICNKIFTEIVKDPYFQNWKKTQQSNMSEIKEAFSPLPVFTLPLLDKEIIGIDSLKKAAQHIFLKNDPVEIFYHGRTHSMSEVNGKVVLTIALPFVEKKAISLLQNYDELILQIGNHRRNLILPSSLIGLSVEVARLEKGELKITFNKTEENASTAN